MLKPIGTQFAAIVEAVAKEREACAQLADAEANNPGGGHPLHMGYWKAGANAVAKRIRARSFLRVPSEMPEQE